MDLWQHIQTLGDETHPDKPQYTRGVHVFTCPYCAHTISSANFLNVGYFQIAARTHLQSMACALAQAQRELAADEIQDPQAEKCTMCAHPRAEHDADTGACYLCTCNHFDPLPF